jgi:hypothetical protein
VYGSIAAATRDGIQKSRFFFNDPERIIYIYKYMYNLLQQLRVYIYMYIYIYTHTHIYIYIYRDLTRQLQGIEFKRAELQGRLVANKAWENLNFQDSRRQFNSILEEEERVRQVLPHTYIAKWSQVSSVKLVRGTTYSRVKLVE